MKLQVVTSEAAGGVGLRASLFELAIRSSQLDHMAEFHRQAMGYEFVQDGEGLLGTARDRRLRISPGDPKTLDHAAFALADAAEAISLHDRLSAAGWLSTLEAKQGWIGEVCAFRDPDGNALLFGLPEPVESPATGMASQTARLQHVVLASTDIERMLTFYRDIVGFGLSDRVVDEAGALMTVFLRCSHEHHSLAVFAAPSSRLDHWCHETDGWGAIRDWADHFAELDLQLQWGPGRHGPGNNLFVFVHDPDGNWIELSAELEQVTGDRPVGRWQHHERTLNSWGMGKLRA